MPLRRLFVALAALQLISAAEPVDNWAAQSFYFNWNELGVDPTVSVPQTAQCEDIHLSWQRASGTTPDYVPPFYLRVYTSTYPAPLVIDAGERLNFTWTVPFAPGTQYQICMVDSKGNSGGCQAPYIVYANNTLVRDSRTNATRIETPQCQNVTYPTNLLKVDGWTVNGPLTQMAWADQCTDIAFKPANGTPPYTLTVAPAYHPPSNNSFEGGGTNWTVTLGWAHIFYVSIVDAQGASWATGPLHSGGNGKTDCLVLGGNSIGYSAVLPTRNTVPVGALAGGIIGALILGIVVGALAFFCFSQRKKPKEIQVPLKRRTVASDVDPYPTPSATLQAESPRAAVSELGETLSQRSTSPNSPRGQIPRQLSDASGHQVYVVHHDAGRAPISVYTPEGANVVELPPSYGPRGSAEPPGTPDNGASRSSRRQKGPAGLSNP